MDFLTILITALGIMLLIFIPGISLTFAFFPRRKSLDMVERAGLSFVLGLTPQFLLYFLDKNFFVPVNFQTTFFAIFTISVIGALVWKLRAGKA